MNRLLAAGAALWLVAAATAFAVETRLWELTTADEFREGELEGTIVSSEGAVFLGASTRTITSDDKGFWSAATSPDGTLWVGSGESGKIFRLQDGVLKEVAATGELTVTDLLVESDGVYAATIPNGKVFKIKPDGTCAVFATLPAKQVWGLVRVGEEIFAGTGPEGRLFGIDGGGKVREVCQVKVNNILALAAAPDGTLYFGSDKPGVLFGRAPDGRVRSVHDFGDAEVRSIALTPAGIVVCANKVPPPQPTPGGGGGAAAALARLMNRGGDGGAPPMGEGDGEGPPGSGLDLAGGEGFVYRIDAQGRREELLHLTDSPVSQVRAGDAGGVFVAGGSSGNLYRIRPDGVTYTLLHVPGRQVLGGVVRGGQLTHAILSSMGGVVAIEPGPASHGAYVSKVFDAGFSAEWGNAYWVGNGRLAFATRSGNTVRPDDTWSEWSKPATASPARVQSPAARFVQFRVEWGDDPGATLRVLRLAYLIANQCPRVRAVDVGAGMGGEVEDASAHDAPHKPAGNASAIENLVSQLRGDKPATAANAPGNTGVHKLAQEAGVRKTISWTAEDSDGDALVYRVWCAREGTEDWIPLTPKAAIEETEFSWDSESFPDGYYVVRVEASDEKANPEGQANRHSRVSAPILVDNSRPRVLDLAVSSEGTCTGSARDAYSIVRTIEYSLDGGTWVRIAPVNRLNDSAELSFSFPVAADDGRTHVIAVRAVDLGGNVGSAQVTFRRGK